MALTPKQQRFVDEYLIDLNATQAAIRAGYRKKAAYAMGRENLHKPQIAEEIARRQAELADQAGVTVAEIVAMLKVEAKRVDDGASHSARVRAIELLGKHIGMFKDRLEVSGTVPVVIIPDNGRGDGT